MVLKLFLSSNGLMAILCSQSLLFSSVTNKKTNTIPESKPHHMQHGELVLEEVCTILPRLEVFLI